MKAKKVLFIILAIAIFFILSILFFKPDYKLVAQNLLQKADITINGDKPWDIIVHKDDVYPRVIGQGSLGLGESYMEGCWDCKRLDQFFEKIFSAELAANDTLNWPLFASYIKSKLLNLQSQDRAFQVAQEHYDLSNELFKNMLDRNMVYSCGYWKNAPNLDQAQINKLDLICKKLYLKPGMKILDIGCGWGGLAAYAAKNYGVEVTGVTVSKEQAEYAKSVTKDLPIRIMLIDYRDLKNHGQQFDRIVSVGMFEHVGYKNYKEFMEIVHQCLKDDGLFLLHTIGRNTSATNGDPWITKYIFPNGMLPSVSQISDAAQGLFVMEDWHNFGTDYDKTLMAWHTNFVENWPKIKKSFDEKFYRMWRYYLLSCAALFRSRNAQLWQIIFSKNGLRDGYTSIR